MSSDEKPATPLPSGPFVRPNKPLADQRIAVIGAGPAGLSVLCAFAEKNKEQQQELPRIVCFERQSAIGGQWNTTWKTGTDEFGEPVHSGMYQHLWSNGPKEGLEFANYTFDEHFGGKAIPSYPPREVLSDYVLGRAKKFDLVNKYIELETAVRRVTFDEESTQLFTVVTQNLKSKEETIHQFDYVICCSGHFHVPNVPTNFQGLETFPGRVLHAHDVRSYHEFRDKRMLVIGTSYSAEDVAVQAYKFGCRDISLSYRTAPMPFHWPEGVVTYPLLQSVDANGTATFKDGSTKENIDVIVLSTGYLHTFPFMEQKLQLNTSNFLWIDGLYKGIFWNPNPRLMYMAMHDQWLTFNMFDAQAWYARDVILGTLSIPDDGRQADMDAWAQKCDAATDDEGMIRFQTDYTADLVRATDYPTWDFELTVQTFLEWEEAKHKDIFGYRNAAHKSAFTGTMAPVPSIPWKENMDDSLNAFLKNC